MVSTTRKWDSRPLAVEDYGCIENGDGARKNTVSGRGKAVLRSVADYFAGLNSQSHSPIPLPQITLVPPKWCKNFNYYILRYMAYHRYQLTTVIVIKSCHKLRIYSSHHSCYIFPSNIFSLCPCIITYINLLLLLFLFEKKLTNKKWGTTARNGCRKDAYTVIKLHYIRDDVPIKIIEFIFSCLILYYDIMQRYSPVSAPRSIVN